MNSDIFIGEEDDNPEIDVHELIARQQRSKRRNADTTRQDMMDRFKQAVGMMESERGESAVGGDVANQDGGEADLDTLIPMRVEESQIVSLDRTENRATFGSIARKRRAVL